MLKPCCRFAQYDHENVAFGGASRAKALDLGAYIVKLPPSLQLFCGYSNNNSLFKVCFLSLLVNIILLISATAHSFGNQLKSTLLN